MFPSPTHAGRRHEYSGGTQEKFFMHKMRSIMTLALGTYMLGTLAACGGDNPTPTAVPTNTPAPPTATPVPPTATPAPPTSTALPATAVPTGGQPASSSELAMVSQALTNTRELKSYHFTMEGSGDVFTQPLKIEGDFVAPDKVYVKGMIDGVETEELATGGQAYSRTAGGKWTHVTAQSSGSGTTITPVDLQKNPNPRAGLGPLLDGSLPYKNAGSETINGTQTTHFQAVMDLAAMMGGAGGPGIPGGADTSLGSIDIWAAPDTKLVHKIGMDLDLAALINLMATAFAGMEGTPGPGTPTATPLPTSMKMKLIFVISKHNDPSITVPAAPTDAVEGPTATPGGSSTGGSGTDSGPAGVVKVPAGAGHTSASSALEITTPADTQITLADSDDVVYLKMTVKESGTLNVSIQNPGDGGKVAVTFLDAKGDEWYKPSDVNAGGMHSLAKGPMDPGTYYVTIKAVEGEKVSKEPIQVYVDVAH
jgi:hypothetical protein